MKNDFSSASRGAKGGGRGIDLINHFFVTLHMELTATVMGWLQVVGSLKLQVSFAKKPFKRDYILQGDL